MRTIAIVNQKGGCGKTTISINLASALAESGHKTLLVDMDPQSHCAVGLAVPEDQVEQSIYDVLISDSRDEPMRLNEILWQINEQFELAPASIDLSAFEQQMAGINEREKCLKRVLDEVDGQYDFTIIDCPPAVSLLTFNALHAATDIIVPVETGYFSLHGLSRQLETLSILCRRSGATIDVRVLASLYDIRTKMAREVLAELRNHFNDRMFKTVVNFNTKIKEAASFGQPINEYDSASKGAKDFSALADEIIGEIAQPKPREAIRTLSDQLESISASANEILRQTNLKPEIKAIEPPRTAQAQQMITEDKLVDYYGVNQISDAIMFVTLYPRAKAVAIAGDFNNWQPTKTPLQKVNDKGIWKTQMKLPAGTYRYRLVVDGQWQQDPYNANVEPNPYGGFNSLVDVK